MICEWMTEEDGIDLLFTGGLGMKPCIELCERGECGWLDASLSREERRTVDLRCWVKPWINDEVVEVRIRRVCRVRRGGKTKEPRRVAVELVQFDG